VSSTTSWRRAAAIVCSSRCSSARIFATPNGWLMNSSPERRCWPACALAANENARARRDRVDLRLVLGHRLDQLIDELLMTLRYLEYGHRHILLRASEANPSAERACAEGKTVAMPKFASLRKRLFHRRKRADVLAALLAELLGRPAH